MRVTVYHVSIPAMNSTGFGYGLNADSGEKVCFVGDHRPMRDLGEALDSCAETIEVDVEDWQIISIIDPAIKKPKQSLS